MDASAVGNYAAAVRLSESWYFIPMAITSSVFPSIINAKKQSEQLYYQRLQKLYDLMVWLALAIAIPTTFLAPWIIRILYGKAFVPAAEVLSIHIWAGVFVFLGFANGRWIVAENVQYIAPIRSTAGGMMNIVLNIVFIPKYGINGAAITTLFSVLVASHIAFLFINKARRIFIMQNRSFFRPILWIMARRKG
jgi:O-antigen/teichoic acid export membrane protein